MMTTSRIRVLYRNGNKVMVHGMIVVMKTMPMVMGRGGGTIQQWRWQ